MKPNAAATRTLWTITAFLVLIGVAVVTRRMLQFLVPSPERPGFAEGAAMDAVFARHPALTIIHIVPGLVFLLLGPCQFVRTLRTRRPALHRAIGRVYIVCGLIVGVSALVMSPRMTLGGANQAAATIFFALIFLFELTKAYLAIRARKVALHREWMIRAFAIGLAVTTIRPIVGLFFATMRLSHLTPHEFFGTAFWLGFTLHLIAAEVWIDYTRPAVQEPR